MPLQSWHQTQPSTKISSQQLFISAKLAFRVGFLFVLLMCVSSVQLISLTHQRLWMCPVPHVNYSSLGPSLGFQPTPTPHPPSLWPLLWQPLLPRSHTDFCFMDVVHRPWLLLVLQQRDTTRVSPPWGRLGCQVEMRLCSHVSSGNDKGEAKSLSKTWFHFALPTVWRMASAFPSQTGSSGIPGKEGIDFLL